MYFFHILLHLLGKSSSFCCREQLPQLPYQQWLLPDQTSHWFTTEEFHHTAKNHCAAVCNMNSLLYYKQNPVFREIHPIIGNGPVFNLKKAGRWFYTRKIQNLEQIKSSLLAQQPCALLLSTPRHDWHWVLVTGCLQYSDGSHWLRIADGWHKDSERYYSLHHDHDWISCVSLEHKKSPIP